jgi:hypothetical protein
MFAGSAVVDERDGAILKRLAARPPAEAAVASAVGFARPGRFIYR